MNFGLLAPFLRHFFGGNGIVSHCTAKRKTQKARQLSFRLAVWVCVVAMVVRSPWRAVAVMMRSALREASTYLEGFHNA